MRSVALKRNTTVFHDAETDGFAYGSNEPTTADVRMSQPLGIGTGIREFGGGMVYTYIENTQPIGF